MTEEQWFEVMEQIPKLYEWTEDQLLDEISSYTQKPKELIKYENRGVLIAGVLDVYFRRFFFSNSFFKEISTEVHIKNPCNQNSSILVLDQFLWFLGVAGNLVQ